MHGNTKDIFFYAVNLISKPIISGRPRDRVDSDREVHLLYKHGWLLHVSGTTLNFNKSPERCPGGWGDQHTYPRTFFHPSFSYTILRTERESPGQCVCRPGPGRGHCALTRGFVYRTRVALFSLPRDPFFMKLFFLNSLFAPNSLNVSFSGFSLHTPLPVSGLFRPGYWNRKNDKD